MDAYVAAGSASALLIVAAATTVSWKGSSRRGGFNLSDIGPVMLVLFGANTIATAAKIGHLLIADRIKIEGTAHGLYESVGGDELIFLIGGVFAALIIGFVTIQDGYGGLVARNAD